jgi:site-specific recombinase XerD
MMELTFVVVENHLDHLIATFLRIKRATRRRRTAEWYENVLRYYREATRHLGHEWPPLPEHCLVFLESLQARKLAESSQNNYFRALRAFLNWLCERGFIQENPLDCLINDPQAPRRLPKAPAPEAMALLLGTIVQAGGERWQHVRDLALFSLALDAGPRIGELATLQVGDVNTGFGRVRVYGRKDWEDRTLVIGDETALDLERWLRQRAALGVPARVDSLFVSNYQAKGFRPLTPSGMRQRLKVWQRRAGVERFTFHSIRHAYAIYSLRNGADLLDVRDQMGHASIKTTAVYTLVLGTGRGERHRRSSPRGNLSF